MWDKKELIQTISKLTNSSRKVCPNELYQSLSDCLFKTKEITKIQINDHEVEEDSEIIRFITEN